jgi:DNA-binding transcriptional LysR family regulator
MGEDVADPVLDRRCAIGLMGSMPPVPPVPPHLNRERLLTIRSIKVVSPKHPLAKSRAPIPMSVLAEHIQLVHANLSTVWRTGRLGLLKAAPRVTFNSPELADSVDEVPIASRNSAQPRVVNGSSRDAASLGMLVGARHNVR